MNPHSIHWQAIYFKTGFAKFPKNLQAALYGLQEFKLLCYFSICLMDATVDTTAIISLYWMKLAYVQELDFQVLKVHNTNQAIYCLWVCLTHTEVYTPIISLPNSSNWCHLCNEFIGYSQSSPKDFGFCYQSLSSCGWGLDTRVVIHM